MSGKVINTKRIQETVLWKKLRSLDDQNAKPLIELLPTICEEASDRMKAMSASSPQYTLHDESHFLRVVELIAMVLGESINLLKPPYKIWLENNEILEITESDLQRWRDSKPC